MAIDYKLENGTPVTVWVHEQLVDFQIGEDFNGDLFLTLTLDEILDILNKFGIEVNHVR